MYKIKVTYDTGDSFHQENDVTGFLDIEWKRKDRAKQALKDIEAHYHDYMIMNKEWNIGKEEKDAARQHAKRCKWCVKSRAYDFDFLTGIMLRNDTGERVYQDTFWIGYFESLVGAEIVHEEEGMKFTL